MTLRAWTLRVLMGGAVVVHAERGWAQNSATVPASTASTTVPASAPLEVLRLGVRALMLRQYPEAITLLARADREGAGPLAAYNLGLAYRAIGRRREALLAWERYAATPETNAPAGRLEALRQELNGLRAALGEVEIDYRPNTATVRIDGVERPWDQDETRASTDRHVHGWFEPGTYQLTLEGDGIERQQQSITVVAGRSASLRLTGIAPSTTTVATGSQTTPALQGSSDAPGSTPVPSGSTVAPLQTRETTRGALPWWMWVGVGAAGVGSVTAVALGIDGALRYGSFVDRCATTMSPACADERDALQPRLDAYSGGIIAATTVGVVGLALVIVGVLRWQRSTVTVSSRASAAIHWVGNGFELSY